MEVASLSGMARVFAVEGPKVLLLDVAVTGSQKALMLPPGLGFLALSDRAWAAVEGNKGRQDFYLDLKKYRKSIADGDTPFTPANTLIEAQLVSLGAVDGAVAGCAAVHPRDLHVVHIHVQVFDHDLIDFQRRVDEVTVAVAIAVAALVGLVFTVWAFRRRYWAYGAYMLVTLAVLMTSTWYFSIPRMLLSLFPIPILLAHYTQDNPERHQNVLLVTAPLAVLGVIVFTQGKWFY